MPERFAADHAGNETAGKSSNVPSDATEWWRILRDPQLDELIDRAIQSNPSIEIALARVQQARTFEAAISGRALPAVGANAAVAKGTGNNVARAGASPPLVAATDTSGLQHINGIFGFDAGWEIDLFGKYRRRIEAARYDTQALLAVRNGVLITVIADVARTYVDMRGLQMQLAVLHQNIKRAQTSLNLVQARYDRGITNELDVTLAQRQLAALQAEVAPTNAQIDAARYAIAVLIGSFPEHLEKQLLIPALIPEMPTRISPGLPLELVRRRPDIREAEWELAGATARVGVATANLFPTLSLTAGIGYQRQGLGTTPVVNEFIWSAGGGMSWSLLDFGTLDALVDVADLRTHELLANYKRAVLDAVREVDSALGAYDAQQDRLRKLGEAMLASQRALSLASQRYDRGLTDFLNVVDAERQQYELEQEYAQAQTIAAEQFIALYKGLGGGWEQRQSIPSIRDPQPAVIAAFRRLMQSDGARE